MGALSQIKSNKLRRMTEIYLKSNCSKLEAALEAGFSEKTAKARAYELFKNSQVQLAIAENRKKAEEIVSDNFVRKRQKLQSLYESFIPDNLSEINPELVNLGIKALMEDNKMAGHYAPEKHANFNLNANTDNAIVKEIMEKFSELQIAHEREY